MAGTEVVVRIIGHRRVHGSLRMLDKRISDRSRPLEKAAAQYINRAERNLATQGSEFGEPWSGVSKDTIDWRDRFQPNKGDSLFLQGRFSGKFMWTSVQHGKGIRVFNYDDYFVKHQSTMPSRRQVFPFGNTKLRKVLPRRVMLKIDQKLRDDVHKIFEDWAVRITTRLA